MPKCLMNWGLSQFFFIDWLLAKTNHLPQSFFCFAGKHLLVSRNSQDAAGA